MSHIRLQKFLRPAFFYFFPQTLWEKYISLLFGKLFVLCELKKFMDLFYEISTNYYMILALGLHHLKN